MTAPSVFVIAEAGSNWRMGSPTRDLEMATRLIDVAADAGADAIKFQTYRARTVYVQDAGTSAYLAAGGEQRSINDIFEDLEMPYDMIPTLAQHAEAVGLEFMSTPFSLEDFAAVDPYVSRHKVASYEICHVRLIQAAARSGKPVIMSTGAAQPADIEFGVASARQAGARDITLLQCTASYPAPPESLNLLAIPWLRDRFDVAAGLSDHSVDPVLAPTVAVALGATVVEKHFTLDRRLPGPDHPFALEPDELARMVQAIRSAAAALGVPGKEISDAEAELRAFAVRAIHATREVHAGEPLVEGQNIDVLRPGERTPGLHPRYLDALAGRRASRDIGAGRRTAGRRAEHRRVTAGRALARPASALPRCPGGTVCLPGHRCGRGDRRRCGPTSTRITRTWPGFVALPRARLIPHLAAWSSTPTTGSKDHRQGSGERVGGAPARDGTPTPARRGSSTPVPPGRGPPGRRTPARRR